MGVHGLETFIKQHPELTERVKLPLKDSHPPFPFIIDGVAFFAWLVTVDSNEQNLLDRLRGGNYRMISQHIEKVISYFRSVRLEPEFVWDGPPDLTKIETTKARAQKKIDDGHFYMRSSEVIRSTPNEGNQAVRFPLLYRAACINELKQLDVKQHFAASEDDSPIAELAQRRTGFAVSRDSDFFIFPSNSIGYVPLDTITSGKAKTSYLVESHSRQNPRLEFDVYSPTAASDLLGIPLGRLPILAALCGNDKVDYYRYFEVPNTTLKKAGSTWRNFRGVAEVLATVDPSLKTYEEVLRKVLPTLSIKGRTTTEEMIADLTSAAHFYALQPIEQVEHTFCLAPRASDTPDQALCRDLYRIEALRHGRFSSSILQMIQFGIFFPNTTLERFEFKTVAVTFGRPIRKMIYAILQDSIGLTFSKIEEFCRQRELLQSTFIDVPTIASILSTNDGTSNQTSLISPILLSPTSDRLRFMFNILRYPGPLPNRATENVSPSSLSF